MPVRMIRRKALHILKPPTTDLYICRAKHGPKEVNHFLHAEERFLMD